MMLSSATSPSLETHQISILIFENPSEAPSLSHLFQSWGYKTILAKSPREVLQKFEFFEPHMVICNLDLTKGGGLKLIADLKNLGDPLIVAIAAQANLDHAITTIREGVHDYLVKPLDTVRLRNLLHYAQEKAGYLGEIRRLQRQLQTGGKFRTLTGRSARMQELFHQIEIAAPSGASVLLEGPSGTGKELVARAVHAMSPRRDGPFIAINCSAIPATLLESEIFGYEKGAFTGAAQTKEGCYELADQGTLFLDEIVEMAPDLQSKLLRLLEDGSFRRVGGKTELRADVRIVAASNTPFKEAIRRGRLREDLYYRLNVFCLALPPLRDRGEDIPLLTQYFINEFNLKNHKRLRGADREALQSLQNYPWPGNVRELKNTIERAVIIARGKEIKLADLPEHIRDQNPKQPAQVALPLGLSAARATAEYVAFTLEQNHGNKTRTANALGITAKTLTSILRRRSR